MVKNASFTHHSFAQFVEIRNRRKLCDFVFEIDGKSHFAHKVVLAAAIPYFEDLLIGSCADDDGNAAVPIPSSIETIEALLTFAYSGLKLKANVVAIEDFIPSTFDDVDLDALLQQRFTKFDEFRRSEKLCDFTFMIRDTVFSAHKIVLAASIPLFADIFLNPNRSNVLDYTVFNRISTGAVQKLLQFAYSGEFNPTSASKDKGYDLQEVILAAKLFQVQKLEEVCLNFLRQRLDFGVVQQHWSFAHANDLYDLQEMLQSYVCANFQEFIGTPTFLALKAAELEEFLVRDNLSVTSEYDIFRAIVSWVDNERAHRPSSVQSLANSERAKAFPRLLSRLRLCKLKEDSREQILSHPLCRSQFDGADLELQTKLLRMTLMLKEQQIISRGAQFDRAYRELPTDVLFIMKYDRQVCAEGALMEIFNPIENIWQEFCNVHLQDDPKYVLLNNRIYILKGGSAGISVDVFDVTTKQSKRGATGYFGCQTFSAIAIHDHILFLVENDRTSVWWAYDTLSNKWKKGPNLETFRREPCLVTLQNRYVLVIGGTSRSYIFVKSVEYCEPGHAVVNDDNAFFRVPPTAGSTWSHPAPPLPEERMDATAAELDGRIFVVGCSVENWRTPARTIVFCPQMGGNDGDEHTARLGGQWFLMSPESPPPSISSILVSHAGRLYLFGPKISECEVGISLCFRPCSEQELENMRQGAVDSSTAGEGAASEVAKNENEELPVAEQTAASDNLESENVEEDKVNILLDSDPFSAWRWRPFCAPYLSQHVRYAGVVSVAMPSGRQ
uniref:BTB domain-containing protein n=1 Tax=Schistocephalus solidus TaxID=70667 RepID=A0A0X3NIN7_SCHSO